MAYRELNRLEASKSALTSEPEKVMTHDAPRRVLHGAWLHLQVLHGEGKQCQCMTAASQPLGNRHHKEDKQARHMLIEIQHCGYTACLSYPAPNQV